ncbi:hypothetical protein [Shinella sp.]|uniref:hypothetical protein n=1 Tax=Shinella sp. TaxID=1870904 RepID=UPI00258FD77B|nr:hypothetical protein [Shinella sp.]MCW5711306.1 hypothetical protein [Shinella sp.]
MQTDDGERREAANVIRSLAIVVRHIYPDEAGISGNSRELARKAEKSGASAGARRIGARSVFDSWRGGNTLERAKYG